MADRSTVAFTGPASHTLVREPGVGSLTVGPVADVTPDLVVGVDDTLDWSVFDGLTVPAGYPWPRVIRYHGNDTTVFGWARHRPIETLDWTPASDRTVDASGATIARLGLRLAGARLDIVLPAGADVVSVSGDPALLRPTLAPGAVVPALAVRPDTAPAPTAAPLRLPAWPGLASATSVAVDVSPLRQPFDCASLDQFTGLRKLSLRGSLANLGALAGYTGLTGLELRHCPDLSALPPLATWPHLTRIIGWNIDAAAGQRLRAELRRLAGREWTVASVTQLRKPEWFTTEYGLPFAEWPARSRRAATLAYHAAQAAIATDPAATAAAVRDFVLAVNKLPALYTVEREDIADAVARLGRTA